MTDRPHRHPEHRLTGLTRRDFLAGAGGLGAAGLIGGWPVMAQALEALPAPGQPEGEFLGIVPFTKTEKLVFGEARGRGLAGRRLFDVATLSSDTLITPADQFFLRTRKPEGLLSAEEWKVRTRIQDGGPTEMPLAWFHQRERDLGVHLIEGTSNGLANGYGAISAARWTGVPVTDLLDGFEEVPALLGLMISGFDRHAQPGQGSRAGASWIFSFDQLRATGAFLATRINGQPLTPDQGAPLRLVVPGWFGCTCIKWVEDVVLQELDATSTQHMRDYAPATFQEGRPRYARMFSPAAISFSAVPVRIERWRVDGEVVHRILGIAWGGDSEVRDFRLSVVAEDHPGLGWSEPLQVRNYTPPTASWTLWSHTVKLKYPGTQRINIVVHQNKVPARRISRGKFTRRFIAQDA